MDMQQARPGIRTTRRQTGTDLTNRQTRWQQRHERGQTSGAEQQGFNDVRERQLASALGWLSLGVGLAALLAPKRVGNLIGLSDHGGMLRLIGAREIGSGIGILTQPEPRPWLWSRVGGDVMDLALLSLALRSTRNHRGRVAMAAVVVAGATMLDVMVSQEVSRHPRASLGFSGQNGAVKVEKSLTVNCSAEEAYRFWHDFANLPSFMLHLKSVAVTGDKRSHWVAKAPAGMTVEWDAEVTGDKPHEAIAWRSLPGADVENSGSVQFEAAPGGRGTIVRVQLQYYPPGGAMASFVAKLFGEDPAQQIREDLRRFKQMIETGEVATTEGQSSGPRSKVGRLFSHIRI